MNGENEGSGVTMQVAEDEEAEKAEAHGAGGQGASIASNAADTHCNCDD